VPSCIHDDIDLSAPRPTLKIDTDSSFRKSMIVPSSTNSRRQTSNNESLDSYLGAKVVEYSEENSTKDEFSGKLAPSSSSAGAIVQVCTIFICRQYKTCNNVQLNDVIILNFVIGKYFWRGQFGANFRVRTNFPQKSL
jgi:hypothetical protein